MAKRSKEPKVKVGDRFDKLVALKMVNMPVMTRVVNEDGKISMKRSDKSKIGWECRCDCGEKAVIPQTTLLKEKSSLRSCGKCPPEKNTNHIPRTMTYEENQEWEELYEYVKKNIFGYDNLQRLPKYATLRLLGLSRGKYMANNNNKNNSKYPYSVILNTFKFCSNDIHKALRSNAFKDEQHKFNYIVKIVEEKINDIYIKTKNMERAKEEIENIDMSHTVGYVNTFKKKENKKTNNRLDELW